MPLVQLDLNRTLESRREEISDAVHQALRDGLDTPPTDRFQVFRFHDPGDLIFDPKHGGVDRQNVMWIQITMQHKYDVETKKKFFRHMAQQFDNIGLRHEDLLISILEYDFDDVYPGRVRGD